MRWIARIYWTFCIIALGAIVARAAVPISSEVQKTAGPITSSIPTVANFTVSTVATLVTGVGSVNLAYVITNEDSTNAIRCEYGAINNTAPTTTPTSTVGRPILGGTTYVELIAPNNRLDCIAAAGSPKVTVTIYPK